MPFPGWALDILACPHCFRRMRLVVNGLSCEYCGHRGAWEDGVLKFGVDESDPSIRWYRDKGGAQFQERVSLPFTMSSLDTPLYHSYLEKIGPDGPASIIIDVGAGDGRNAEYLLHLGYRHIVAIDPVAASLNRFQLRARHCNPAWLERLLLVQGDARTLPILPGVADLVLAVESLYYLNEDYELGLGECSRILKKDGRIFISERAWEGTFITQLIYAGISDMLKMDQDRYLWEGPSGDQVRLRTFKEDELLSLLEKAGLSPVFVRGLSILPVILGYLRQQGKISHEDGRLFPDVVNLLQMLDDKCAPRRTHVILAQKPH